MIFLAKGTFRFCLVLLRELLLSPILYVKNILILEKAVKRRVRKPVTTDTVYVEVHEWLSDFSYETTQKWQNISMWVRISVRPVQYG